MRLLAEHRLHQVLDLGDARGTAHEHHLVDVAVVQVRVLHGLHDRPAATLDQMIDQLLELGPGDGHLQVFRPAGVGRNEREVDVARLERAQLLLGLLAGFLQTLQGHGVLAQVYALFFLELLGYVVDEHAVEVVAAQVRVAVGADHAEHAFGHFQHRDVNVPPRSNTTIFSVAFLSSP